MLAEIGGLLSAEVNRYGADRIAGIPFAGLPLAVATSLAGQIPLLYARPEAKTYGTARRIEGLHAPGERVIVIDDIVTDGTSKLEAIAPLEAAGLVVKDILVLVDREQGGAERLAARGYTVHALLKITECFEELEAVGLVDATVAEQARAFIRTTHLS